MEILQNKDEAVFEQLNKQLQHLDNNKNSSVQNAIKKIKEKIKEELELKNRITKENKILKIGIVGQVKAGKSSFLNSLIFEGENVLPKASTPMTAGLTVLKYGDKNLLEAEFYSKKEWELFENRAKEYDDIIQDYKAGNPAMTDEDIARSINIDIELATAKELVLSCGKNILNKIQEKSVTEEEEFTDVDNLQNILKEYVGVNGKYTSIVKCLTIQLKDERLQGVQIVDTPGVNDPVLSREQRTREFLRSCHGVFFLSFSSRFFDSTDVNFLVERIGNEGVGTVVLIASKFDSVLQDVGMKFKDDLSTAIDDCKNNLKKQYNNNISQANFSGSDPIFDVSSGIGFSIANKPKERWDEVESHVVKQMKIFYPSFFSTDKDIKDMFFNLSQIDDIRNEYLEGTFKLNKERIIEDKLNSYFVHCTSRLKKTVKDEKKKLEDLSRALSNSNISDMEKKRDLLKGVIKKMKGNIDTIQTCIDNITERYRKECSNSFKINWNGQIPTHDKTVTFTKKKFIGNKSFVETFNNVVDTNKLIASLNKSTEKALDDLNDKWKDKAKKLQDLIRNKYQEIINKSERDDHTGKLDADILRNILDETLEMAMNKTTLELSKVKKEIRTKATDILTGIDSLSSHMFYEGDAPFAISEVKDKIQKLHDLAQNRIVLFINSTSETCIGELKVPERACKEVFCDQNNKFIEEVDKQTQEYLNNLEKDLEDKKNQLWLFEQAISDITKIENIL